MSHDSLCAIELFLSGIREPTDCIILERVCCNCSSWSKIWQSDTKHVFRLSLKHLTGNKFHEIFPLESLERLKKGIHKIANMDTQPCNVTNITFPKVGASFDLSDLQRNVNYVVGSIEGKFLYYFNICANIDADDLGYACSHGATNPSLAFQIRYDLEQAVCQSTGVTMEAPQLLSQYLFNEDDPTLGVVLTYVNGDECKATGSKRRTKILVYCSSDAQFDTEDAVMEELNTCEYTVRVDSILGCPQQCPIGGKDREICSGHGVCVYDHELSEQQV